MKANTLLDRPDHSRRKKVGINGDLAQDAWPLPSWWLLLLCMFGGVLAPKLAGLQGILAMFLVATFFPSTQSRSMFRERRIVQLCTVVIATATIGNFDAIGDLAGYETIRFSWVLVGMSAILLPSCISRIRDRRLHTFIAIATALFTYQILTALGTPMAFRAVELNASYLVAFILVLSSIRYKPTRYALTFQLSLVAAVAAGFNCYEMLYPSSELTISSSRLFGMTRRAAGLYANSIASGLTLSAILVLAALACENRPRLQRARLSLGVLMMICGVGVCVTFSRSAAAALFMASMFVAFRMASDRITELLGYAPITILFLTLAFFGVGEFLSSTGTLTGDATKRYDAIKGAVLGDAVGNVRTGLSDRSQAWEPTKRYWSRPKLFGEGSGFVAHRKLFQPHNMYIVCLVETGTVGLGLFLIMLCVASGVGYWQLTSRNCYLFSCVAIPILLITIESHSFLTRRYFCLQLASLVCVSHCVIANSDSRISGQKRH